jgi:hypothetical protein
MKTEEGMSRGKAILATAATVLVMFGVLALIGWLKSRYG